MFMFRGMRSRYDMTTSAILFVAAEGLFVVVSEGIFLFSKFSEALDKKIRNKHGSFDSCCQ